MATRAFYEFYGEENQKILGVYIHWDGYPQGAAQYFKKAIDKTPGYLESELCFHYNTEQFLSNFVRFNEEAEISIGGIHGDEEYIYKIDLISKRITTMGIDWGKVKSTEKLKCEFEDPYEFFETIDECSIAEFLEKYKG